MGNNNGPLKENIIQHSKEFNKFTNIFDNSFYKQGIYNDEKLSPYISVLYCIDQDYNMYTSDDIKNKAIMLKQTCNNNIYNIVKKIKLNIIIFDFNNESITAVYDGNYFNPYISTIFISKNNEYWEPIINNDTKMFSYSSVKSNVFKYNILTKDINCINLHQTFCIMDNIIEIMEFEELENNDDTFITQSEIKNNLSKTALTKMKKDELFNLCSELGIDISNKKIIKKELIELIINT